MRGRKGCFYIRKMLHFAVLIDWFLCHFRFEWFVSKVKNRKLHRVVLFFFDYTFSSVE